MWNKISVLSLMFLFLTESYSTELNQLQSTNRQISEIVQLIKNLDSAKLKLILNNINSNEFDSSGASLLAHAVMTKDLRIVKLFIKAGANPNIKNKSDMGETPLMVSSNETSIEIPNFLIVSGADVNIQDNYGDPVIHWTAYYGNRPLTLLLLQKGAKANLKSIHSDGVMQVALKEWQYEIVELLIDAQISLFESIKNPKLIKYLKENNVSKFKQLFQKANLNDRDAAGNSLLMIASQKGYLEIATFLINQNTDLNALNPVGQTALNLAIFFKHNAIAKLLIDKGAKINETDKRYQLPALVAAIRSNNIEMSQLLLKKSCDIEIKDGINYFTPIMWAVLYKRKEIIIEIMKYKPDLSVINKYKMSVFNMTQDKEILKLLITNESQN